MKTVNTTALLLALTASTTAFANDTTTETTDTQALEATETAEVAETTEAVDMSNPMSVYSAIGLQVGTNGQQISAQVGYSPEDGRSHMGMVEYRTEDNLNNYRLRYFTPNEVGFGFTVDASRSEVAMGNNEVAINTATAGFMQMLPVNEKLMLFPTVMAGSMWSEDQYQGADVVETTTIATAGAYIRYLVGDDGKFWLYGNPMYTYGFDGEETREMYFEGGVGYKVSDTETLRLNANNDGEVYFSFTMAL